MVLKGVRIALLESRYSEQFASLFEKSGAHVRSCPLVTERILEDRSEIRRFIELAVSGTLDFVILMTGIGTNLILGDAEAIGERERLLDALARMTVVCRGPKSLAALRKANVRIDVVPKVPTSEGIMEALESHDLAGKRVAVQLYGTEAAPVVDGLKSRAAVVLPVSVYSYIRASDEAVAASFIRDLVAGEFQIVVFTSATQVKALFDGAAALNATEPLIDVLTDRTQVASIGEVTSRALSACKVIPHIVPDEPKMGTMFKAICTSRSS